MAKGTALEFFYDCSSPWTYLAFSRILPICESLRVHIEWRPIIVGGVFNEVNQGVYSGREQFLSADSPKLRYYFKDLADWARLANITLAWPTGHPINAVNAMRGALFANDQGKLVPYSLAVFKAYWGGGSETNIADPAVLARLGASVGVDPDALLAATKDQHYKDRLRANTDELIARGGFGSPTLFIGEDMYFGNDRLELVQAALRSATHAG
ncbi:MAG: 2-hydroxychromene-2-carboxylate isomerase [Pseudomonadota bacterium]